MGFFAKRPPSHAAPLVFLLCFFPPKAYAVPAEAPEFRLMEAESALRRSPADPRQPQGRDRLFALAEHRFDNRLSSAEDPLLSLDRQDLRDAIDWLGLVYRVKLAGSGEKTAELERRLKTSFSARQFFAVFDDRRTWRWRSPAGHEFEFREFVDRLEINRDGAHFYTLELA